MLMIPLSKTTNSSKGARPFVKWAGGKKQLLDSLELYFPKDFKTYYEPFLGGGAVFFYLVNTRPRFRAVLSDTNAELILTYNVIKTNVEDLIGKLLEHAKLYRVEPKEYFYKVRASEPENDLDKAALLIFLNRTCFNGLYRVNSRGKFNVPFGRYENPKICDEENLRLVSAALNYSNAEITANDYMDAVSSAGKDDFVYFDPPYQPVSSTANFTSYTKTGFSFEDQENLSKLFKKLHQKECYVVLSNSNTPEIQELYKDKFIKREKVVASRAINCKGNLRKGFTELIIYNQRELRG